MIGSILAATYTNHVNLTGLPDKVVAQVKASYAIASHMCPPISDRAHTAFAAAMHIALLTAAGAALVAAAAVLILLARRSHTAPAREGIAAPDPRAALSTMAAGSGRRRFSRGLG